MRHLKLFLFLIATLGVGFTASVSGQNRPPPQDAAHNDRPEDGRPNLLAELGLSPEQVQQIRRMNQARRPLMAEATQRLRIANRNLDVAIYADTISDAEFQTRLKEFHAAQGDVARLRFEGELAVRKVLTPEQLVRFRDLRQKFAEAQNQNRQRRMDRRDQRFPPMQDSPPRRPVND